MTLNVYPVSTDIHCDFGKLRPFLGLSFFIYKMGELGQMVSEVFQL
jgi:hypothetical protein